MAFVPYGFVLVLVQVQVQDEDEAAFKRRRAINERMEAVLVFESQLSVDCGGNTATEYTTQPIITGFKSTQKQKFHRLLVEVPCKISWKK